MLTVLSQHTSDVNADRAFGNLRAGFPTTGGRHTGPDPRERGRDPVRWPGRHEGAPDPDDPRGDLDRRGAYDLTYLDRLTDEEARRELSPPGVGLKSAAVVLSFSRGRDAMPVDTHVHRVTTRLGLVPATASAERADRILHEPVPEGKRTELHAALIRLGRELCKAPTPGVTSAR